MANEGYIRGYVVEKNEKNMDVIRVDLKYSDGMPAIRELKTVSKPGRRTYSGSKSMARVHNGLGVSIVTTPRGVMTDSMARSENVGGEVLCQVF
jgi:small subunit ribosomal protein S8